MILEELYRTEHEGKTLIAIGNGSEELGKFREERLGSLPFYLLDGDSPKRGFSGRNSTMSYALEEKDFDLFNAYKSLPEGYEMVGYGDGSMPEEGYDYFYLNDEGEWKPRGRNYLLRKVTIYSRTESAFVGKDGGEEEKPPSKSINSFEDGDDVESEVDEGSKPSVVIVKKIRNGILTEMESGTVVYWGSLNEYMDSLKDHIRREWEMNDHRTLKVGFHIEGE